MLDGLTDVSAMPTGASRDARLRLCMRHAKILKTKQEQETNKNAPSGAHGGGPGKREICVFIIVALIVLPVGVILISMFFGGILAAIEDWTFMTGFYWVPILLHHHCRCSQFTTV